MLIPTDNSSTNDTPSMPESASEDSGVLLCQVQVPMLILHRVQVPMLILPHLVTYLKEDTHSIHGNQIHSTLNCNCYLVVVNTSYRKGGV